MTQLRLAIGVPAYGGRIVAEHARMFLEIGHMLALSEQRFQLVSSGYLDVCGIDKARNELLLAAIEAKADWLLMIDADTWVVGDGDDDAGFQLLRMISEADRAEAAIVGAPVIRRTAGGNSREVAAYFEPLDKITKSEEDEQLIAFHDIAIRDELMHVDALGTAVFAINLRLLCKEGGQEPFWFEFADGLSEDLHYCKQVRDSGGKILLDGRVRTAHLSRPYPILSKVPNA